MAVPDRSLSRRNFYLGIPNGALTMAGSSLVAPETVLAAFVVKLMGGNVLWVGLLVSLFNSALQAPTVLLAGRLESRPRHKPYYLLSSGVRLVSRTAMALVLLYPDGLGGFGLFAVVSLLMLIWALGAGIGIIPFWSIMSDSIPPAWRGRFLGLRQLTGGLLTLAGGFLVAWALSDRSGLEFPQSYGLLAVVGAVLTLLGTGAWCLAEERPHAAHRRRVALAIQMRRGPRFLRRDTNYRRLVRASIFYGMTMAFVVPFVVPFALKRLELAPVVVGTFIIVRQLAYSFFSYVWSYISDHYGNRLLLIISGSLAVCLPLLMLGANWLPPEARLQLGGLSVGLPMAYLIGVYLLIGATTGSNEVGQSTYLLEVAPPRRRSTYLGFVSTVNVFMGWAPLAGALLIGREDRFVLGFGLALAAAVVSLYNLVRLHEVRFEEEGEEGHGHVV